MSEETDRLIAVLLEDEDEDLVKDVSNPGDERGLLLTLMREGVLEIGGSVSRRDHHYVHQYTTNCELSESYSWPDDMPAEQRLAEEERVGKIINIVQEEIDEQMRDWNSKIYEELEAAYEDSLSDEVLSSNAEANEWTFDESGNFGEGDLTYDQLSDEAKQEFRQYYDQHMNDTDWWSEHVILEWKWLLRNKGFESVEINFSGFSSQGDGASFTSKHINFLTYMMGPDPLEFPEQDREQLSEAQEEDDQLVKAVSSRSIGEREALAQEQALMVKGALKRPNVRNISITPGVLVKTDRIVSGEIKSTYEDAWSQLKAAIAHVPYDKRFRLQIAVRDPKRYQGRVTPGYRQKFSVHINCLLPIEEDQEEDKDLVKELSKENSPLYRKLDHIQTKGDYAEYEKRVRRFFANEGVEFFGSVTDEQGNTDKNEFSSRPCDICHRPLAGTRVHYKGTNPETRDEYDYWICTDCEYYVEYEQLDDMTMMDMKDDPPIQERYGGAAKERGIWYHGTSSALIPKVLSQGLIGEPKKRAWDEDPYPTSNVQTTRKSLPGSIYVTTNLGTATGAAQKVAHRDKANQAIVVMELQPRSLVADEDDVNYHLKHIAAYAQGSTYHHIWPYFVEVYGDQRKPDRDYGFNEANAQKLKWVDDVAKVLIHGHGERKPNISPELEKRVKELLFNEGYRVMLERNVAYIKSEGDWDMMQWKKHWAEDFGDYDSAPPVPNPQEAEDKWLKFSDLLARTLKNKARPIKGEEHQFRETGRLLGDIGFNGSNRIICIVEIVDARDPDYRSRMLVHYGKPPEKLINDWTQNKGPLDKPDSIVYKNVQETGDHWHSTEGETFWGDEGAGGIFVAKDTGRILIGLRSENVEQPHTWGTFGGATGHGEAPAVAAEREMREESGYRGQLQLIPAYVFTKGDFQFHNFIAVVPEEFEPRLDSENTRAEWVKFGHWPSPLHFGLAELIQKSGQAIQHLAGGVQEAQEDDEEGLAKEVSGPPSQRWFYEIRAWPTCKSINYFATRPLDDEQKWKYKPGSTDGPLLTTVGGHTFPKRSNDEDLRLLAQAQIRVFKATGRFDPEKWKNVWDWMKAVRSGKT